MRYFPHLVSIFSFVLILVMIQTANADHDPFVIVDTVNLQYKSYIYSPKVFWAEGETTNLSLDDYYQVWHSLWYSTFNKYPVNCNFPPGNMYPVGETILNCSAAVPHTYSHPCEMSPSNQCETTTFEEISESFSVILLTNELPVALDDSVTMDEYGSPINIKVLANDYDPDESELRPLDYTSELKVITFSQPEHGYVEKDDDDNLDYTLNDYCFIGNDQFTYTIQDGAPLSATLFPDQNISTATVYIAKTETYSECPPAEGYEGTDETDEPEFFDEPEEPDEPVEIIEKEMPPHRLGFCAEPDHSSLHFYDAITEEHYGRGLWAAGFKGYNNAKLVPHIGDFASEVRAREPFKLSEQPQIGVLRDEGLYNNDKSQLRVKDSWCLVLAVDAITYNKAVDFANSYPLRYGYVTQNCTDFVVDVANHIGVKLPDSTWFGVSDPATLAKGLESWDVFQQGDLETFVGKGDIPGGKVWKAFGYGSQSSSSNDVGYDHDKKPESHIREMKFESSNGDMLVAGMDLDHNFVISTDQLVNTVRYVDVTLPQMHYEFFDDKGTSNLKILSGGQDAIYEIIEKNVKTTTIKIEMPANAKEIKFIPIAILDINEDVQTPEPAPEVVESEQVTEPTPEPTTEPTTTTEPAKEKVPAWIKKSAGFWVEGAIDDQTFVNGIGFLIKEKIIDIPDLPEQSSETTEEKVPAWIKNNAKWWADGLIDEDTFVNGIKWLVEKGIIRVS